MISVVTVFVTRLQLFIAKTLHWAGDRAKYVCVLTSDGLSIEDSRVKVHLWKIALSVR